MAFFICQSCGAEYETAEEPRCPSCGRSETIRLNKSDRLIDKVIAGRYRLVRKLGQGGMGAVYLAEQIGIGHQVAIKFLKSEFSNDAEIARRFLNEAKTYVKVRHPNAVTFHEFGQDDEGNLFIAMEYCEGVDLKKTIADRGRLSVVEAVEVTTQVADVLADAHEKQIVHRDLKPENIMIRKGLRGMHAKVLDFGIARLMDASTKLTMAGAIAGTPRYMSPEQVEGREADIRADIYSLGIVCFEALTGRQPFDGNTIAEILRKQATEPLPRLASIEPDLNLPGLQAVLDKACAKRREDRYPDMLAFASALSQAVPPELQLSLPPLQRVATSPARVVPMATPHPGQPVGVALPGSKAGHAAIESTMLQHPTVPPAGDATGLERGALTQQPGVGSINPRSGLPDESIAPAVPRQKGPMIGVVVLLVALIGGGAAVLLAGESPKPQPLPPVPLPSLPAPPPVEVPEVAVTPEKPPPAVDPSRPPTADPSVAQLVPGANAIHDFAALEALKAAQTNWEKGEVSAARTGLASIAKDTPAWPSAVKLLGEIQTVQDAIAEGDALRLKGQCAGALKAYAAAARLNGNIEAIKRGVAACKAAVIPGQIE